MKGIALVHKKIRQTILYYLLRSKNLKLTRNFQRKKATRDSSKNISMKEDNENSSEDDLITLENDVQNVISLEVPVVDGDDIRY